MQNKKKRGLLVGVVTALLACMCVFIALAGCSRAPETYRPESPSVGAQPPRDGSTPEDYDPLENIGYVIGRLAEREYYHSENTNRAEATSLGFIRVEQNVQGSKDYKDGILITSTVSTSSSSFAPSKAIQKYYGDRSVIVRTAASADPADWMACIPSGRRVPPPRSSMKRPTAHATGFGQRNFPTLSSTRKPSSRHPS